MGASSQKPLTLHTRGVRDKQLKVANTKDGAIKDAPAAVEIASSSAIKSKAFSPHSFYKKHIQKYTNKNVEEEAKWRVSVSPDDETGESIQITMLKSHEDMASSTSASSEDGSDVQPKIAVVAGGEKRLSKLSFFKNSKRDAGDVNNDESEKQNGERNDKPNEQTNGDDGNSNNNDEGKSNGNNGKDFNPKTYFGPERIAFAQQSTLPLHAGPESDAPTSHPSWTPALGSNFHVRVGPNYAKTGKKAPSMENLYEVYSVRYFRSPCRTIGGATRIMPLPEMMESCTANNDLDNVTEGVNKLNVNDQPTVLAGGNSSHAELKNTKIPDVLVVHFMLPYESPNAFKHKDDGPGGECVYYLRPSQRFLDEVSGKLAMTPATRLFVRWCNECQSNVELRSRFKCMALVRDIEKHNLGLLKSYNGKPVLITESGRVCSGFHGDVRYLEMTANVHYWAYIAKKGFVSIIPKFKNMQMEVGFTIEGQADNELPECMLGSTVLSYISDKTGPMITPEMQQPVHEHQS